MAERKSGPVKPPIIDLTARPAEPAMPEAVTEPIGEPVEPAQETELPAEPEPARKVESPKSSDSGPASSPPRRPSGSAWVPAAGGAVAGAVIAVVVCYGLAYSALWPSGGDTGTRIDQLQARLADAEKSETTGAASLGALSTRLGALETDFAAKLSAASGTLAAMQQSLDKLQQNKPASVDLSPLEAQVKTLSARLDAVAAGASSADAGALAANLSTVQQTIADLSAKLAALDTRAGATDTAITSLKGEFDTAKSAIEQAASAPSPKTIASAMQLPLLISALEADFAAGRPYAADLNTLTAAVPEAHVPASLSDAAAAGLPAPEQLAQQFEAAMPAMLGARPAGTDSSWQGQMSDWVKNVLALRPEGEVGGDGPDAVLSRLEAAVNRHDFAAATTLLGQLPPPMQQAAGDTTAKIRGLADADNFVAGLRKAALAPAAGAQK